MKGFDPTREGNPFRWNSKDRKAVQRAQKHRKNGDHDTGYSSNGESVASDKTDRATSANTSDSLASDESRPSIMQVLGRTRTLPRSAIKGLPNLLTRALPVFNTDRERDVFTIGALAVLSGCLPMVWGRYFNKLYAPNLFAFVVAPAGSGKSALEWCYRLGQGVDQAIREEHEAEKEAWEYRDEKYRQSKNAQGRPTEEKPGPEPRPKQLFIPGSSSAAGMIERLGANDGHGVLFETEADTVSQTLEKEWGTYSDVLRKAHPHEPVGKLLRDDEEKPFRPCLSVVLSGTPGQLPRLIPSVENGLWSRFCMYGFLPDDPALFRDPWATTGPDRLEDLFEELTHDVCDLRKKLHNRNERLYFTLTEDQRRLFLKTCQQLKEEMFDLFGHVGGAVANRAGLHIFRLAMTLRLWSAYEGGFRIEKAREIECSDADFEVALDVGTSLLDHGKTIMQALPQNDTEVEATAAMPENKRTFFRALPDAFTTKEAKEVGERQDVPERTVGHWLKTWKENEQLLYPSYGHYEKP
jgi:hypothetical protein